MNVHRAVRCNTTREPNLALGCKDARQMGVIDHTGKEKEESPPLIILVQMPMKSESKWEAMDARRLTAEIEQTAYPTKPNTHPRKCRSS